MRAARVVDLIAGRLGWAKPIVFVSGFWRSGTTWIQELPARGLHAKTVFEPLCPLAPARRRDLVAAGLLDAHSQEAFLPGRTAADDPMWRYLDTAFPAIAGSRLSFRCRDGVGESFRRSVIVKDVRLQLNLGTVHRRYGVPVVHMRRHPCAVAFSLMSAEWSWNFEGVRLAALIAPLAADLRRGGISGAAAIRQIDGDAVSRIAAFWAITERLTEQTVRGQPWAAILAYEDAVLDPGGAIDRICKLIGRRPTMAGNPDHNSATTYGASRDIPPRQRLDAWRCRLSTSDTDRIYSVVEAIFPEALARLRARVE